MLRKLRQLLRNFIYLSEQDYRRAHDQMLAAGRRIERNAPSDLRHCPVCEAELGRTSRLNGEVVSFCPRWQAHPAETQPRVRQVPFPDYEPRTDKLQRPMQIFHQEQRAGAGPHTAMERAIPKPKGR